MSDDLSERCAEILEWQRTGLLHGGSGGVLRALADRLREEKNIPEYACLHVAEKITADEAMLFVINHARN